MPHALSMNLIRPGHDDVNIMEDTMGTLFDAVASHLQGEGIGKIHRIDMTVWAEGDDHEEP